MKLVVHATTIDARPFLKPFSFSAGGSGAGGTSVTNAPAAAANGKDPGFFKNIDLELKCGLLTGYNKKAISSVELRFAKQNDQLRQFSLSGHFGRDMLAGSMAPGSSQLNLSTRDAGS